MSSTLTGIMLQFHVAVLSWVYTQVCHLPTYSSTLFVIKLAEMLKQSSVTVGYYEDESGELQYDPLAVIPDSAYAPVEVLNPRALLQGTPAAGAPLAATVTPAADPAGAAQGTPADPSVAPTGTPAAAPLSPISKRMAESARELAAAMTVCTRFNTPVVSLCFARAQPHILKLFPTTHIIYRNVEHQ